MKAQTARQLRKLHQYVGLFFTPAILFFALSGGLQTIGLHENHGAGPPAPTWIRWMASVHKDQHILDGTPPKALSRPPVATAKDDEEHGSPGHQDDGPSPIPMKAFVLLLALGLMASSVMGVTIAMTNRASRKQTLVLLALGVVVPLALLFL